MGNTKSKEVIDYHPDKKVGIHKDFHAITAYIIKYFDENFDSNHTSQLLQTAALNIYSPLIKALRDKGLSELYDYWQYIFSVEQGEFEIDLTDNELTLDIKKCPTVSYLNEYDLMCTGNFCLSTVLVNKAICEAAGYKFTCEYDKKNGACVQKVAKRKGTK